MAIRGILPDDQDTRVCLAGFQSRPKVGWHRSPVVTDQYAAIPCGPLQNFRIGNAGQPEILWQIESRYWALVREWQ